MKKRSLALLLALCLALPLALGTGAAGSHISLFIGDGIWEGDARAPFIESVGRQLIPVSALGALPGMKITVSERLGSVLIERGETYLSLNLESGTALEPDGNISEHPIYRYGGELYIAPDKVCAVFGLTFETAYAADGFLSARIGDGSELLSFEELLSVYAGTSEGAESVRLSVPAGRTVAGVFMHPVLLVPAAGSVGALCRALGAHRATFALSPGDVEKYAAVLLDIYAAGHTVAWYMDSAYVLGERRLDGFIREMTEANAFLFALLGKTSRVYVSIELYAVVPEIDGYYKKSCRMNLIAEDLENERIVNMTLHDSPMYGIYNFSLSGDYDSRRLYADFFRKFDAYSTLVSMPLSEAAAGQ